MAPESSDSAAEHSPAPEGVMPEIAARRSVLAFDKRPVGPHELDSLVEAARWAPSASNSQPWRVTFVTESPSRGPLNEALSGGNRAWAPAAPLLVVYAGRPEDDFRRNGADYYLVACGLSAENLILQAEHMGLRTHPMAGWNEAAVKAAIGVPEEYRVVVVIAIGHPGDPAGLPYRLSEREAGKRSRLPRGDNFFREHWGEPWD